MTSPIWKPSSQRIATSNMQSFITRVNETEQLTIQTYNELYHWSIIAPEKFWPLVWDFCQLKTSKPWRQVISNTNKMSDTKWFPGAELNFAENLLRVKSDKPALIFRNEQGMRRELSYLDLQHRVTQFACALKNAGIAMNDRVVAFIPNIPEAVIAMLATSSIGAIWSSCSPDFGVQGVYDRFGQIAPKVLFTTDAYLYNGKQFDCLEKVKQLCEKIPSIEHVIVIPYLNASPDLKNLDKAWQLDDFIEHHSKTSNNSKLFFQQTAFDHPLFIMYSSGTTGVPKCIVHGAGGTLIQIIKELVLHTNLTSADTIFYYTTCGWMMWNWYIVSLAVGATVVLYDGSPFFPGPQSMFDLIDAENISVFGTSAKYISAVEKAQVDPIKTHQLMNLHTIVSSGSPLLPMNYDFVYQNIKQYICLASVSGGTDIISCFALGNPILPVYRGELQCRGLGLSVEVFDENANSLKQKKGELVCTAPFPSMPIYFWNDPDRKKYHNAYFNKFPNVWAHGDYAEITEHDGMIIYGRSDAVLNPGGVRIGTAEIYRQVETIDEILESIVIGQDWNNDIRIILFVKLRPGVQLSEELVNKIKAIIRKNASPHHVPAKIIQVTDIPRTISGKIVELAVRDVIHGKEVKNIDAMANPEALEQFKNLTALAS